MVLIYALPSKFSNIITVFELTSKPAAQTVLFKSCEKGLFAGNKKTSFRVGIHSLLSKLHSDSSCGSLRINETS